MDIPLEKAEQLSASLAKLDRAAGMKLIEKARDQAINFDVIDDAMCILHPDGSASIIDLAEGGHVNVLAIQASSVLAVLKRHRPPRGKLQ